MKKVVLTIVILLIATLTIIFIQNRYNDKESFNGRYSLETVTVKDLTLEEKISQMLIVGYISESIDNNLADIIIKNQPGGFIVQGVNFSTYEKTKKFIERINSYNAIPMFMCVDQEGGSVQRIKAMKDETLNIPSAKEVGNTNSESYAYNIGKIIGEQSRSLGLNTVLAPTLDLGTGNTLKDRTYSSDSSKVTKLGGEVGKGIEDQGLIAVYKHFPGIGSAKIDTHAGLSVINKTKEEMLNQDLKPFISLIDKMNMVMIGHTSYPKITGNNIPSSISKEIINDLLRNELGYKGVVMIDAINMKALSDNYSEEEIYKRGIEAGVDLFIMPSNSTNAINIVKELVNKDPTLEDKINESVERILNLKKKKLNNFISYNKDKIMNQEQINIINKKK